MNSYTSTGSGTTNAPAIDYNNESLAGGTVDYTNGQLKATLLSVSSTGTLNFRVAKNSGYFVNGNSGKLFIITGGLDVYAKSFTISNSTTSYIDFSVSGSNFTGTRSYRFYLITSDQVYKQYGGLISVTGSQSQLPPTVQTYEPTDVTSTTAHFSGVVNPNGSSTTYYFKYGNSTSMNKSTTSKTLSASAGETTVSFNVSGLSSDSRYYVQLYAENSGGSSLGAVWSFDTDPLPNNPPERPDNPSPANASKDNPKSGTLSWSCSDPEGDAITYRVYISTSSTSGFSLLKSTSNKYCSYSLDPATKYYWYVEASDGSQSSTSQTWNFTTKSDLAKPTNPSPADYATDVPTSGTFSWYGNNSGSDVRYEVYLGTSSVSLSKIATTQQTSYSYSGLDENENYFWKVVATDGNQEASSALWTFKTLSTTIPVDNDDCEFSDLPKTSDFYEPTCYLANLDVISGSDINGKMEVESNLRRAHLAKICFRGVYSIKGRTVPTTVPSDIFPTVYSDLTDNTKYYYQAARALLYLEYDDGITPFDRNRLEFAPEEYITRLHTLKVLLETFNIKPDLTSNVNPFPNDEDVVFLADRNPMMMGYIRKAASLGIIKSDVARFRPNDNCLRGEAFTMLARIMQMVDAGLINDPNPVQGDYFEPLNTTLATISLGLNLPLGNFNHYTKSSFALSGTVPLVFAHSYNSYNTTLPEVFYGVKSVNGVDETYQPLGDGWSHNYHSFITVVGTTGDIHAVVHWGGGSIDIYKSDGSKFVPESYGVYDELILDDDDVLIKTKSQMTYRFSKMGSTGAVVMYLSSVTDRNGNRLTLNYEQGENGSMRITSVTDGNRSLTFSYKANTNLISKVSDPLGRNIRFGYALNNYTGRYQLISFTDAEGQTTNYSYGDESKLSTSKLLTRIKLPKGNYIENEYDANRRLKKTESGLNGVPTAQTSVSVSASYSGQISTRSQVQSSRGSQTSTFNYTYNENNVVNSLTGDEGLAISVSYGNNDNPQLPTSMHSNSTDVSSVEYDDKGNITSLTVKSLNGSQTLTTTMTYDDMNNVTSVTDPKGYKTTFSYDSNGNLIGTSAPEGVTTSVDVNSKGLPRTITDAMGVVTQLEYNSYGNLTKSTLPALGITSSASYDRASRMLSSVDALGRTTTFTYNNNDFVTSTVDAFDNNTTFGYDDNDNLISITNAAGGVTTMTYDNTTDWLLSVSFADATKQYSYNEDGSLDTYTKPDGTIFNYKYDDLGRVTNDGVSTYTYDDNLRLSEVSSDGKRVIFEYDGFNRIIGTTYDGHSNSYTYDANGNCTSINDIDYDYDKLNRLTSVSFNGKTISYTYRKDSQISRVDYPNGMNTQYGYDEVGRLISKTTRLNNGTVIASYSFELDKVGNILKQTAKEPYTALQLNNEQISYSYNSGNRITTAGDIRFSFDENGNTVKRGSESFVWDKLDRLTRAGSTTIKYDPLGHIVSYGDIEFTTDLLGSGNVIADSRSGAEYIYGNGLEARVVDGKVSYYVTDVRGSVVAIVDNDGNITHKYQYDEFGKVVQKQEADYNPFQYVGKYGVMQLSDHLYYMRARHYDPTIGRFLSEDPIWSTNLYPYADNNPIMGIDPEGLKTLTDFETIRRTIEKIETPVGGQGVPNIKTTSIPTNNYNPAKAIELQKRADEYSRYEVNNMQFDQKLNQAFTTNAYAPIGLAIGGVQMMATKDPTPWFNAEEDAFVGAAAMGAAAYTPVAGIIVYGLYDLHKGLSAVDPNASTLTKYKQAADAGILFFKAVNAVGDFYDNSGITNAINNYYMRKYNK